MNAGKKPGACWKEWLDGTMRHISRVESRPLGSKEGVGLIQGFKHPDRMLTICWQLDPLNKVDMDEFALLDALMRKKAQPKRMPHRVRHPWHEPSSCPSPVDLRRDPTATAMTPTEWGCGASRRPPIVAADGTLSGDLRVLLKESLVQLESIVPGTEISL